MNHKSKITRRIRSRSGLVAVITGNICSGKSFISKIFQKYGFRIISSDQIVNDILTSDHKVSLKIKNLFPEAIDNNVVNKKKLANIVFFNQQKLTKLESILHPKVIKIRQNLINKIHAKGKRSIIQEIPLLYETNKKEQFNLVISALATSSKLRQRALNRKGMTADKFHAIYKRQSKDLIHITKSDLVVLTGGTKLSTIKTIRKVIKNVRVKRDCARYRDYRSRGKKWSQNYRNRLRRTYQ